MKLEKYYTLDFEAYSEVNLKKKGSFQYSMDDSTRVTLLGYSACDTDKIQIQHAFSDMPYYDSIKDELPKENKKKLQKLYQHIICGGTIVAFNTLFEYYMWNNVYVKQFPDAPKLKHDQLLDAKVMANRLGASSSLEDAGKILFKEGKDIYGRIIMLKLCRPQPKNNKNPVTAEDINSYIAYCKKDVLLTKKIVKVFTDRYNRLTYSENERIVEQETLRTNVQGIKIDTKLNNVLAYFFKILKKYNDKKINKLTEGVIDKCTQDTKILKFLVAKCDYPKKSISKDIIRGLSNYTNKLGNEILKLRLGNESSKLSKTAYIQNKLIGDRISPEFVFHSAVTGRFVSRGSNMLNFARPVTKIEYTNETVDKIAKTNPKDLVKKLKSASNIQKLGSDLIRKIIIPEDGHRLLVADYSQIERRLLCVEAGFKSATAKHKAGTCEYSEFATKYFKEKVVKGDPRRNFGKVSVLQGGYKGGFDAFKDEFAKYGIEVTNKEVRKVVDLYRDMNKPIVRYWARQHDKIMRALGTKKPLIIKTISGRELIYRDLQLRKTIGKFGEYTYVSYATGKSYKKLHGGILTSHIIQSIARDLLIGHMATLTELGYVITLPVHDEVVINIKSKREEEEILKVLNYLPTWLDYPHGVDYSVVDKYCK